jgi:hypothetical protein
MKNTVDTTGSKHIAFIIITIVIIIIPSFFVCNQMRSLIFFSFLLATL